MADRPSRSLVIVGDSFAPIVNSSHSNLNSFASQAVCGFLSLRSPPSNETESDRIVRELAQLLDVYDSYVARTEKNDAADAGMSKKEATTQTISERFMGMKAAIATNSVSAASFAKSIGFDVLDVGQLISNTDLKNQMLGGVPSEMVAVHKLLCLLGFSQGEVLEECKYDLVLLHIRAGEKLEDQKGKMVAKIDSDWLDKLIGGLFLTAQISSSIASRLHISTLLSYGTVADNDNSCFLDINSSLETDSDLSLLRPRQSYCMKGGNVLDDIRHHHPLLLAQLQEGVTRKDTAKSFSFEEFKQHGANLSILADRFLHELAFKLWKAPKYGA